MSGVEALPKLVKATRPPAVPNLFRKSSFILQGCFLWLQGASGWPGFPVGPPSPCPWVELVGHPASRGVGDTQMGGPSQQMQLWWCPFLGPGCCAGQQVGPLFALGELLAKGPLRECQHTRMNCCPCRTLALRDSSPNSHRGLEGRRSLP